jgi:short-subunit dehydrogenase
MKQNVFQDQVAIVTGASSGIGRSLAVQLANQGAKVVLAARRADMLEKAATECRALGVEALAVATDISDEAQCKRLIENAVATFGKIDMLINNAGLNVIARLEDYSNLDLFRHTIGVNFYGAVHCTYYALPTLIKSGGRIVAISSLGGKTPLPYNSPYIASKYAMHGFFDSLRMELKPYGVSVTIICPYWVVTGFHEAQMDKDGVPKGASGRGIYSEKMMTADHCAAIALRAAEKRRREVLMGPGRLVVWLNLLAPELMERASIDMLKRAVRRERTKS